MKKADQKKAAVAMLSIASNTALVAGKLIIGIAIGSVSVLSEAIHSGVDLMAAVIAWVAVRKSAKPADTTHPFGHGKVENVSGVIEALLIFVAAGWIIFEAAKKLSQPEPLDAAGWGVAIMLVSSMVNIVVSRQLFKVGRETESVALLADAWHLRTDVYTSAGVMIGLALIWLGGLIFPDVDLRWIDPVAAIIVALLIIKAAYDLTLASARDLLDASLPQSEVNVIREQAVGFRPSVRGIHSFRTRKAGSFRFVEFHMMVDGELSVEESHDLTDIVTDAIQRHYPGVTVTIHVEPCLGECEPTCVEECLLDEKGREKVRKGKGLESH
jgi:cation diffusion facilitator family transporter